MPLPKSKSKKEINYLKKKYLFYGDPKSGKTTTAANLGDKDHKMLFFCAEPGHSFVEIYKWEKKDGHQPTRWEDFIECCRELYKTDSHDFSLLVIDTVDILWNWCTEYVCRERGIEHPSEQGFGKAYQAISNEFASVCNGLGQRGLGFIFISHKKEFEAQVGPHKKMLTDTTLPSGAQKFIHGFVDYIWFFTQNAEGKRYILTDREDGINAGSRGDINDLPLPRKLPMNPKVIIKTLVESKRRDDDPFYFDETETIDL